jgi:YHS domain-containing protein
MRIPRLPYNPRVFGAGARTPVVQIALRGRKNSQNAASCLEWNPASLNDSAGFGRRRGKLFVDSEHKTHNNNSKHMKKTTLYIAVLAGAFGVLAFTPKLAAADCPMLSSGCSTTMPGCCGGTAAQPMADDAKVMPDQLTTCPVSGEKLGEMGAPYTFTYKDQEVKLCCKNCKKDFDKDPAKYMALIRAADKK